MNAVPRSGSVLRCHRGSSSFLTHATVLHAACHERVEQWPHARLKIFRGKMFQTTLDSAFFLSKGFSNANADFVRIFRVHEDAEFAIPNGLTTGIERTGD